MFELLKKTLEQIKPSKEEVEQLKKIANEFGELLKKYQIDFFFGGSFAKGTFLKNVNDIDVYLLMDREEEISDLKKKLKKLAEENNLNLEVLHGSRDYFHLTYKGILFEMVPILNIKNPEEATNSTDISKFHVEFVKSKIKENPKLKDEILLFKYFLKQKGLYGAESYNKGFSGYLAEVLVIYFGSFLDTLEFFSKTTLPIEIPKIDGDLKSYLKNHGKLNDYFNVLDPVLNKRNLGMAVSKEKVLELIFESKKFFISPNFEKVDKVKELFEFYKKLNKEKFALLKVEFTDFYKKKYSNPDIIGSKMLKKAKEIENLLMKHQFPVHHSVFKFDKNKKEGYHLILTEKLPELKKKKGPNLFVNKEHLERFLDKCSNKSSLITLNNEFLLCLSYEAQDLVSFIEKYGKNEEFKIKIITD